MREKEVIEIVDFYRMRMLIRQCGKAWRLYQDALHSADPKGQIITDMPRGGGGPGNPVERAVIKADDMYQAYQQVFRELQEMRAELKPLIDQLSDPTDKAVMRLRYLDGFAPNVIADSNLFPMSRAQIYRHLYHAEQVISCWCAGQNG